MGRFTTVDEADRTMARLSEDTKGKIRDLPIQDSLKALLIEAATRSGIDLVRVTSGGQAAKGTPGKRTGSTRHDLGRAADLSLSIGDRTLSFVRPSDLPFFRTFVTEACALGATGIGAGIDYMGPVTIHVGYGEAAFWGRDGKAAFAPGWLKEAVLAGRDRPAGSAPQQAVIDAPAQPVTPAVEYIVVARSGLNLRGGPGRDYPAIAAVPAGTHFWSASDSASSEWVQVDLDNDGLLDGFVARAYLARV